MISRVLFLALALQSPFSSTTHAETLDHARVREVSRSKEWYRLMHYRRAFPFYPLRSELDGEGFFFSPEGHKNPEAELVATIEAFRTKPNDLVGKLKQPPTCAFPARLQFIKRVLGLKFEEPKCEKLDDFMRRFNPASLTLVFSSAYQENPGSMFGHTFLRINSKESATNEKRKDLLDYGLSYAASVGPDENPALFIVFGLTGGYVGEFSMEPYYKKVNEYNNGESRDLWEYDLSLSEQETRTVLLHAWELGTNTHFQYYFFDENCSYEILTLLEVAKPEWDISQFRIYIIPSETIKRVTKVPGAVTQIRFRPSLRRRMLRRFDRLDRDTQKQAFALADGELKPDTIDDPRTVEAAVSYLFYREKEKGDKFPADQKKILADLLVRRSELPTLPDSEEIDSAPDIFSQPDRGHYPFSLGLHTGRLEKADVGSNFVDLRFKFAYHDLLNSDIGYLPYSQIDWPAFTVRRDLRRDETRLEELHIFSITAMTPMTFVEKRMAWKFSAFARPPLDQDCVKCRATHVEGGIGAAVAPLGRRWLIYGFAAPAIEFSESFPRGPRLIPHLELATIATPHDRWKVQFLARQNWDLFQSERQKHFLQLEGSQSYAFSRSWEGRVFSRMILPAAGDVKNKEFGLNLNFYFQ